MPLRIVQAGGQGVGDECPARGELCPGRGRCAVQFAGIGEDDDLCAAPRDVFFDGGFFQCRFADAA